MHGSFDQPSQIAAVKYWEIIADNLSKAGWSWGCVATVDSRGHVHADEKLAAFLELESATRGCGELA
jgi:hypothetical protein